MRQNTAHQDTRPERSDVYQRVTDRIIADLEAGVRPWQRPWNAEHTAGRIMRPLRHNGVPYRGVNVLMLWCAGSAAGYSSPHWLSFKQAIELGGNVRKGEHGSLVVYADTIKRTETADDGSETEHRIPFMKGYTVFNAEQCEHLPAQYAQPAPTEQPAEPSITTITAADQFFVNTGATVRHGGNRAFYSPSTDHVQMPPVVAFRDAESYAATLAHEICHWTKHESRLDRELGRKRWGDEGYAAEELVAEIGSAFLCADLRITPEVRQDHAAYVQSWLKVLKDDKRFIFSAAAHAQRAVDYLHGLQTPAAEALAA